MANEKSIQDKPPDENNDGRETTSRRPYANVLKGGKGTYKGADINVNLNRDFKWEVFVVLMDSQDGSPFKADNVKHVDIYDLAIKYGFKEHELAGANPQFGLGQACIYSKHPIDVRSRLEELQSIKKIPMRNASNVLEEVTIKLKGMDKISGDRKKKLTITLVNTFKRVDELRIVNFLKQFGEVVGHYPKRNPSDRTAEGKYASYKDIWRDSDYMVDIVADPATLPQIIPIQGVLIKLKFQGVKLQCQKCFNFGHMKHYCTEKRIKTYEYENALKKVVNERNTKEFGSDDIEKNIEPRKDDTGKIPSTNKDPYVVSCQEVTETTCEEDGGNNSASSIVMEEHGSDSTTVELVSVEEHVNADTNHSEESSGINGDQMIHLDNNQEGIRDKPSKSHIDVGSILENRTRHASKAKRNKPDSDVSPNTKKKQAKDSQSP